MKKRNNWSTPHVLLDNRENRFFGSGRMEVSEKRYKAKLTTKDKKHDERGERQKIWVVLSVVFNQPFTLFRNHTIPLSPPPPSLPPPSLSLSLSLSFPQDEPNKNLACFILTHPRPYPHPYPSCCAAEAGPPRFNGRRDLSASSAAVVLPVRKRIKSKLLKASGLVGHAAKPALTHSSAAARLF